MGAVPGGPRGCGSGDGGLCGFDAGHGGPCEVGAGDRWLRIGVNGAVSGGSGGGGSAGARCVAAWHRRRISLGRGGGQCFGRSGGQRFGHRFAGAVRGPGVLVGQPRDRHRAFRDVPGCAAAGEARPAPDAAGSRPGRCGCWRGAVLGVGLAAAEAVHGMGIGGDILRGQGGFGGIDRAKRGDLGDDGLVAPRAAVRRVLGRGRQDGGEGGDQVMPGGAGSQEGRVGLGGGEAASMG